MSGSCGAREPVPGVRVRVFGWPETWRVVPSAAAGGGWRLRIELAPGSTGRRRPPFLAATEWSAADLASGLRRVKQEIRRQAEAARRRAFLVDESPEDLVDGD